MELVYSQEACRNQALKQFSFNLTANMHVGQTQPYFVNTLNTKICPKAEDIMEWSWRDLLGVYRCH